MCRGRWFILFIVLILTHLGCESIKGTGLKELEGQSVFNRVSFRSSEANKIKSANPFSGGIFIPPGTECSIKAISIKEIKFITTGENYVLTDWRIGYGGVNTRASFYKFFAQTKDTVGLDKVNPDFRENVSEGIAEVGMNKREVLLSLGYPAYLSRKNPTADDSRAAILANDNWYYLRDKGKKVLLEFKGEILTKIVEE